MAYVYQHIRLDTNEVFYVGIGKEESRSRSHKSRSTHWKYIVNKTRYSIKIVAENISYEDALDLEKKLINSIGRADLGKGPLVNKTDGGEGFLGYKNPESICPHCNKKGVGHVMKRWHFDNCAKISKREPEKIVECPHCGKIGSNNNGIMKRWHFDNCSEFTGKPNKNISEEQKQKISMAIKGVTQNKLTCPHCGKIGGNSSMKRYHFDNCKVLHN